MRAPQWNSICLTKEEIYCMNWPYKNDVDIVCQATLRFSVGLEPILVAALEMQLKLDFQCFNAQLTAVPVAMKCARK